MNGLQQQSKLFKEKFNKGIAKNQTYLEKIKYSYKKSRFSRKIQQGCSKNQVCIGEN